MPEPTTVTNRGKFSRRNLLKVAGAAGITGLAGCTGGSDGGGGLHAVETDDEFAQVIEDHPGAIHTEIEPYGWEQDVTDVTDTVDSWALAAQWAFGPEISADAVYEICRLAFEHDDAIRESDPTTLDHTAESMTETVMEDVEVHPGAADFFEEQGVWNDDWTRGEADASGGGEETVTIGATSSGSSSQQAAQAYARAASQHSDSVSIDPQVTSGWTANLQEYDDGNIPGMAVDNNSLAKAINEEGPFADEPVDKLPMQSFMFTSLEIYWVALDGSGIEHVDDIRDGGHTIYPIQPGFGTRLLTEEILQDAGMWEPNEKYNGNTGDVPGAVEEERVDALCIYGANGVELSSWVQEVDVRSG